MILNVFFKKSFFRIGNVEFEPLPYYQHIIIKVCSIMQISVIFFPETDCSMFALSIHHHSFFFMYFSSPLFISSPILALSPPSPFIHLIIIIPLSLFKIKKKEICTVYYVFVFFMCKIQFGWSACFLFGTEQEGIFIKKKKRN